MIRPPWSASPRSAHSRFELVDEVYAPGPEPAVVMRRIAAEALILQDEAEAVLAMIARSEHLGRVAPRGGPLVRRFFALADELPLPIDCRELDDGRIRGALHTILTHHAMQIATALDFLAVSWRSERLADQTRRIGGLGKPAEILDDLYHELLART
jgi:hypothetical protein